MLQDGARLKELSTATMKEAELTEFIRYARHYSRNDAADHQVIERKIKGAIDRSASIGYHMGVVDGYQVLALIHMNRHDNEMAANALKMSETFIHKYQMSDDALLELYNTYVIYYQDFRGDIDAAAKTCQKGITLSRELNNKEMLMKFTANLGSIYVVIGDYALAEQSISNALAYYKSVNDPIRSLYCHANLGEAYLGLELNDLALQEYDTAMVMAVKYEESMIVEEAALGLSKIYKSEQAGDCAREVLIKTCRELQKKKGVKVSGKVILEIISLYISDEDFLMADVWMKEYEEAFMDRDNAMDDLRYYVLKSDIAVGFGDFKQAYYMGKKHYELYLEASSIKDDRVMDNLKANELTRTIDRLETISRIGRKLTMNLNFDNLLQDLYNALKVLMPVDCIGLGTISGNRINYAYYQSDMDEYTEFQTPIDDKDTLSNWCLVRKKELLINDISAEADLYVSKVRKKTMLTKGKVANAIIYVPMIVDDEVIGLFSVQSYETMAYTSEDLETLKVVSSYMAVGVLNAAQAKALKELSLKDPLTGVYNRNGLVTRYEHIEKRRHGVVHMLMIDMDHLKAINDTFGHMAGDGVLEEVGLLLGEASDDVGGIAARLGGEEFTLIVKDTSDKYFEAIAADILEGIRAIQIPGSKGEHITASMGIYHYRGMKSPSIDHLYKYADRALYKAKAEGRDRMIISEEDISA